MSRLREFFSYLECGDGQVQQIAPTGHGGQRVVEGSVFLNVRQNGQDRNFSEQ
ncbi:MAG: hypothetical protein WBM52_21205 [Thiogranum sp.]